MKFNHLYENIFFTYSYTSLTISITYYFHKIEKYFSNSMVAQILLCKFVKIENLNKNQKSIVEIDKNYIQKFVKISMYLKTKKSNTQKIFDSIKDTKNDKELNELVNLLKNQIHTYDILVFHSISMITSLVESDLITFYEIYEC